MKIVLVNKYWYLKGGSERIVFLTKKLLEQAGHTVAVFGMKDPRNEFSNEYFVDQIDYDKVKGLDKLKVAWQSIYNSQARDNFRRLINDFQPDIVHFHNIYHQLSFSLLDVIKETKTPAVMTLHDYKLISPNYYLYLRGKIYERCIGGKYYRCVLDNCLNNFGQSMVATIEAYWRAKKNYYSLIKFFISPSEFLKKKFVKAGFADKQIKIIPNAIDLDSISVQSIDGDYVAFAGRLSEEKGIEVLLSAVKQTPDIPYKIIGAGPLLEKLEETVKNEEIKNVEFVGYQTGEKFKNLLANARLVVVPSVCYESFSLSVLEAKAMGKVVIGSNIGAIPELLPTELLVKPNDPADLANKINDWFHRPAEARIKMGERLRREVEGINNTKDYIEAIEGVYREAVEI